MESNIFCVLFCFVLIHLSGLGDWIAHEHLPSSQNVKSKSTPLRRWLDMAAHQHLWRDHRQANPQAPGQPANGESKASGSVIDSLIEIRKRVTKEDPQSPILLWSLYGHTEICHKHAVFYCRQRNRHPLKHAFSQTQKHIFSYIHTHLDGPFHTNTCTYTLTHRHTHTCTNIHTHIIINTTTVN